jgi:hypothetical protein
MKKFLTYCSVHFTNKLNDIWATLDICFCIVTVIQLFVACRDVLCSDVAVSY